MIKLIYKIINAVNKLKIDDFTKALAECINQAQCTVVDPMVHAEIWKEELLELAKGKEPASEDLEEAARKYFKQLNDTCFIDSDIIRTFKAGANWQKQQIMANTADVMICLPYENKYGGYTQLVDTSRPLPVGNNKIAIIFKED